MRHFSRLIAGSLLLVLCVILLNGCNTTKGAGEDLEEAGEAIQDAADD